MSTLPSFERLQAGSVIVELTLMGGAFETVIDDITCVTPDTLKTSSGYMPEARLEIVKGSPVLTKLGAPLLKL